MTGVISLANEGSLINAHAKPPHTASSGVHGVSDSSSVVGNAVLSSTESVMILSMLAGSSVLTQDPISGQVVYKKPYSTYKKKSAQYYYDEKTGLFSNYEQDASRELRRDSYLASQRLRKTQREEEMEFLREKNDSRALQMEKERRDKKLSSRS